MRSDRNFAVRESDPSISGLHQVGTTNNLAELVPRHTMASIMCMFEDVCQYNTLNKVNQMSLRIAMCKNSDGMIKISVWLSGSGGYTAQAEGFMASKGSIEINTHTIVRHTFVDDVDREMKILI